MQVQSSPVGEPTDVRPLLEITYQNTLTDILLFQVAHMTQFPYLLLSSIVSFFLTEALILINQRNAPPESAAGLDTYFISFLFMFPVAWGLLLLALCLLRFVQFSLRADAQTKHHLSFYADHFVDHLQPDKKYPYKSLSGIHQGALVTCLFHNEFAAHVVPRRIFQDDQAYYMQIQNITALYKAGK